MKVFAKVSPVADKTVIMAVREGLVQPFDAGQWLDLRIGMFISICGPVDPTDDDTITGLTEALSFDSTYPPQDRVWIGLKNNSTVFPGTSGVTFAGFSSFLLFGGGVGESDLIASDAGVGTSGDYWRPTLKRFGSEQSNFVMIGDGVQTLDIRATRLHFVENFAGGHAPGYASLVLFQLTRDAPSDTSPVTVSYYNGVNTMNSLYTSATTRANLISKMETLPSPMANMGPVSLSTPIDSLFLYWPFTLSRLRIHCMGIERIR